MNGRPFSPATYAGLAIACNALAASTVAFLPDSPTPERVAVAGALAMTWYPVAMLNFRPREGQLSLGASHLVTIGLYMLAGVVGLNASGRQHLTIVVSAWAVAQALLAASVLWTWHRHGPAPAGDFVDRLGPSTVNVLGLARRGYCRHRAGRELRAAGWAAIEGSELYAPACAVTIDSAAAAYADEQGMTSERFAELTDRLLWRICAMSEPERRVEADVTPWFTVGTEDVLAWAVWRDHRARTSRLWLGVGPGQVAVTVAYDERWTMKVTAPTTRVVGRLASGENVLATEESHLHDGVEALLEEALARVQHGGRRFAASVDLRRIVGKTTCVATSDADAIVYARRVGRTGHTRFVLDREPEDSRDVTLVLELLPSGALAVVTAWIGGNHPPEPWDPRATAESGSFWTSHALVWGSEPIVPGTQTAICPWPNKCRGDL